MPDVMLEILAGGCQLGATCYALRVGEMTLWLDAGASGARGSRWLAEAAQPHAVWISHAHRDHAGALAPLRARWPRLPVLASETTQGLMSVCLEDAQVDAARASALSRGIKSLSQQRYAPMSEWVDTPDAQRVRLYPIRAGHIPGASMVLVEVEVGEGRPFRLLYTGDFCCHDQPLTPHALVPRGGESFPVDVLVMEGVLACDRRADELDYAGEMARVVDAVRASGGPTLIGGATLGTGLEVLGALRGAGVRVVAHRRFRRAVEIVFGEVEGLVFVDEAGCKRALEAGEVVVAPGDRFSVGSASGRLLAAHLPREHGLVVVCNRTRDHQVSGALVKSARGDTVSVGGRQVERRAKVHLARLPNHAPRWQLLESARLVDPERVILVHGHKSQLFTLRRALTRGGVRARIDVPEVGDRLALRPSES